MEVVEEIRGTRRSTYYFVVDGDWLRPIRSYALHTRKNPTFSYMLHHSVPDERLSAKRIIRASFTGSGGLYFSEISLEDLRRERYPAGVHLDKSDIMKYRFQFGADVEERVRQLRTEYRSMVSETTELGKTIGFSLDFGQGAVQTEAVFRDIDEYVLRCLCMPSDKQRKKSLEVVMKQIHQIWTISKIAETLGIRKSSDWVLSRKRSRKGTLDDPYVLFTAYENQYSKRPPSIAQRSESFQMLFRTTLGKPTCTFSGHSGTFSLWHEFQVPTQESIVREYFGHSIPGLKLIRPDIVVQVGSHTSLFRPSLLEEIAAGRLNFFSHLTPVDLVIECKEFDFGLWIDEIDKQLVPYKRILKPKKMILVSKEEIPTYGRRRIEENSIEIIDNFTPSLTRSLDDLKRLLEKIY